MHLAKEKERKREKKRESNYLSPRHWRGFCADHIPYIIKRGELSPSLKRHFKPERARASARHRA